MDPAKSERQLLFEIKDPARAYHYQWYLSFLATPIGGEVSVGFEGKSPGMNRLKEVRWFPLWEENTWEPGFYEPHIHSLLKRTQQELAG